MHQGGKKGKSAAAATAEEFETPRVSKKNKSGQNQRDDDCHLEETKVAAKHPKHSNNNKKLEDLEEEKDTDFDCPHCKKSFANKNSLKKHKKTVSHKAQVDKIGEIERKDPVYFPNFMDGKTLQIMCPFTSDVKFKRQEDFDFIKGWIVIQVKRDLFACRRGLVPKERALVRYTNINKP